MRKYRYISSQNGGKIGVPDWSKGVSVSSPYTCQEDGYIFFDFGQFYSGNGWASVNGIYLHNARSTSSFHAQAISFGIYVKKGDVVDFGYSYSTIAFNTMTFFPLRKK